MKINFQNNFWDENPELTLPAPLRKIYEQDKTKNKGFSSRVMWGIHLCVHPDSKLYNLPDKETVILRDFIKNKSFKWEDYKEQVDFYKQACLTPAERSMHNWDEVMSLRDRGIKDMYKEAMNDHDADTILKLDRALAQTPKMFDDYKRIKESFEADKIKKQGSKISSLSDGDEI